MTHTQTILEDIFNLLNETDYAVLRNYENLPNIPSRDIDLIIRRKDFFNIRNRIVDEFIKYDYYLIQYYKGSEMHSMVFANIDKKVKVISFDFLFSIYAKNIVMFLSKQVLETKKYNGKVYHVRKDWEFLSKYVYNTVLNNDYPQKYYSIKEDALRQYSSDIFIRLKEIGLNLSAPCKRPESIVKKTLCKKHFYRMVTSTLRYLVSTVSNIFNPVGFMIGFTGPDGSGKTTVINQIEIELESVYTNLKTFHFRPMIWNNLGEVAHFAGIKKEVDRQYDKPHRGKHVGLFSSLLRLSFYSFDYIIGYIIKIYRHLFNRNIVFFDRYYTDIICDSRRSRIYLNEKFLYWFGKLFIPSLDYNILLTADTDTILNRKQELDAKDICSINEKIDYLKDKKGYYRILNDSVPQEAVTKILRIVFVEQHRKNIKRLK